MNAVITKHELDFESCQWPIDPNINLFRVGTVTGQWYFDDKGLNILSFLNDQPGNGHLEDVFQWFEYSAKTYKVPLIILECMNERFKEHLIAKRGFVKIPKTDHVIKEFV